RLLGGGDQSDLVIPKREPTSIEKQIRAMLIKHMGEALTAAWSVLPTPGFQDESKVESDPKMAPGLAPNEVVVEVTFTFRMSGREGEVGLAIPIRALEPHLDGLVEVLSGGGGRLPDASQKRRLDQRLRTITVEGTAVLGSTSITLGELQSMAVGDVVDLDQEQPSFTVGGGAAWPMHVGNRGDRRIVRLGSST
ncbi:MAG: FliM/FliN family flagellar motor switch protein, partial [Planctomycetota bacterium]